MSIVCVTVKIQFGNSRTCKYSVILTLCSLTYLGPPFINSGSAPSYSMYQYALPACKLQKDVNFPFANF